MNKLLVLAVDFAKAPIELQESAQKTAALSKEVEKLISKRSSLKEELNIAEGNLKSAEAELQKILESWNPNALVVK